MHAECSQGKHCYETEQQAYRAAQKSGARNVGTYRHGSHWHITRSVPKTIKHTTAPKSTPPKPYAPSLRKLRAWIESQQRAIKAADRRLAKAEQVKADAEFRAAHILKQQEFQTEIEMQAIAEMVARLRRV